MPTGPTGLMLRAPDGGALDKAVAQLVADRVASRIAAQDPTLWGPDAESEAAIRLAWVDLAETSRPLVAEVAALRDELRAEGVDRVVLAGMGGSSLAPEVITATAGVELVTLDTTDPDQVRAAIADRLARTVLVVSSKSGGTVETDSHRRAYERAFTAAGIDAPSRIVVVTDPGSPLEQIGEDSGYRRVFLADPDVGGRYSALTAFGLVPSGLAGVDLDALLDEAGAVAPTLAEDNPDNPGLRLGALLGLAHADGTEKIVLADVGSGIAGFGDWAEQLIAESTGKLGRGLLPVVVESEDARGFADAGPDAVPVAVGGSAAPTGGSGYAAAVGHPLGAAFLLWEYAVAVAGRLIGINPFDQPDVEAAKQSARELLDAPTTGSAVPAFVEGAVEVYADPSLLSGATDLKSALRALLAAVPERGYVAVQAYLDRHADAAAAALRQRVAAAGGVQTTFGWGPRFLHSTGQYHKGGHPNGAFLQITGVPSGDLAVPDRPYTFGQLQHAQAVGDGSVLAARGRPVLRLHLTERGPGLAQVEAALT